MLHLLYMLSMILTCTPQQTRANRQAMESLVPRVKALSASLCSTVPEGNSKEEMRRKELGE